MIEHLTGFDVPVVFKIRLQLVRLLPAIPHKILNRWARDLLDELDDFGADGTLVVTIARYQVVFLSRPPTLRTLDRFCHD